MIIRKENLKEFLRDKNIVLILLFGLIINLANLIYIISKIKPTPEPIPLHYNIYFGIDLIGKWYLIFLNPLLGFFIYFLNIVISYIIYKRERIIAYLLTSLNIFIALILFFASWLIIRQIV